jgi:hypothetical protein
MFTRIARLFGNNGARPPKAKEEVMRFSIVAMSSVFALMLLGGTASAQQVSKGAVSGSLVQGTADLGPCDPNPPHACPEADLLTAPADKFLIITQVCGYGSLVGPAGQMGGFASGGQCTRFEPGLVVDKGATVKCRSGFAGASGTLPCTIIGVLTK